MRYFQKAHGITYISSCPTATLFEFIDDKRDIYFVDIVWQNLVTELTREVHNIIVGNRTSYDNHTDNFGGKTLNLQEAFYAASSSGQSKYARDLLEYFFLSPLARRCILPNSSSNTSGGFS